MKKRKRRRLKKQISMGITLLCLIAAGCMALLLTPVFNVRSVTVSGNKTISSEQIISGSGVIVGSNIFSVSLSRVRDKVMSIGGVMSVKVKRRLPSTISISVMEGSGVVYIEDGSDYVGLSSDGTVIEVVKGNSAQAASNPDEKASEAEEYGEEAQSEQLDEAAQDEDAQEQPSVEESGEESKSSLGAPIVKGMGEMSYKVGGKIEFSDEKKAENLEKLIDEFLSDEICTGFTSVDMSYYDSVDLVYNGRLNVRLGGVDDLSYKLKCFKAIMAEQLDENAAGTLDLEHLTYSPKNK